MYKKREDRLDQLLQYVCVKTYVSIADIANHFDISVSAVKRDLDYLAEEGCVKRVPGGVVSVLNEYNVSTSYESRELEHADEKKLIGQTAAKYVHDGDIIFIGSGSTCYYLFKSITSKDVVVFTNSLSIAASENPNVKNVYVLGGRIDVKAAVIRGPLSIDSMANVNPSKVFFSSVGVDSNNVILRNIESDYVFTKNLLNKDCASYYLIDSSKFNKIGLFSLCDVSEVNTVITSKRIPDDNKKAIMSSDCNLILV